MINALYINKSKFDVPEGGVALPLRYSINEQLVIFYSSLECV